jgi:hypothetical protein
VRKKTPQNTTGLPPILSKSFALERFRGLKMQEPRGNMSSRMGEWKFFAREKWLFPTLSVFACLFSDQDSIDKKTS